MSDFELLQELKTNVRTWALERGIFTKSSAKDQLAGAIGEIYEFREALIKGRTKAEKERELGDIIVFLINYEYLSNLIGKRKLDLHLCLKRDSKMMSLPNGVNSTVILFATSLLLDEDDEVNDMLYNLAYAIESTPLRCLQAAWEKIKDRGGKMMNGKLVKDGDL